MPFQYKPLRPILFPIGPSIAYVPLDKGLFALIDSEDISLVQNLNWIAHYSPLTKTFYAISKRRLNGKWRTVYIHREILCNDTEWSGHVDHIECSATLDNRRANLRFATFSQSSMNRRLRSDNLSGSKGVSQRGNGWIVRITVAARTICLGTFPSLGLAEEAYRTAAGQYHGEFARMR